MKILFKDNIKSYFIIFTFSILAGLSVVFFSNFPNDDLWGFSYWSSTTLGFWMFSTSLIVLFSEKRKNATINSIIYIFVIFLITNIYKSFRLYLRGYMPFDSILELSLSSVNDWFLYSLLPAIICGILGAVLWSGIKNNFFGKILCIMPSIFIFIETISLFYSVFTEHIKLFPSISNLICFVIYIIVLKKHIIEKK